MDEGLDELRAEGHLSGAGTPEDPYVLEDFYVEDTLAISDTSRSLILRNGYVGGQLRLNYVGESLYVHHVHARDLRINENVERVGTNTGGLFHDNSFAFVGQIRHFVGEFRDNTIGPRPEGVFAQALGDTGPFTVAPAVVFNFDGFHRADVHHNHFEGVVDIKLHGHNHADCFTCPVHNHAAEAEFPGNASHVPELQGDALAQALAMRSHHSVRYVSLAFHDNEILVPGGVALRYRDTNHAGDDRTANSEPNEYLEDPHFHVQDVTFEGNRLDGGRFEVEIFNAVDERHPVQNRGILRFIDNDVRAVWERGHLGESNPRPAAAVELLHVDGLDLRLAANEIGFDEAPRESTDVAQSLKEPRPLIGINIHEADDSNLTLSHNHVATGTYGVFVNKLAETVWWLLEANDFGTTHSWRGEDVAHPPEER